MYHNALNVDPRRLAEVCARFKVARLEVFGSFAEGTADANSDLDVMVTFAAEVQLGLKFFELRAQLSSIFGREVDLHERWAVENSPNKYFRRFALEHVDELYAA